MVGRNNVFGGAPSEKMLHRAGLIGRRCTASTLDLVRREPFKSALVVTTVKTVAADLIVQLAVQKQEWDPRRTALFGAFGFIYQGAAQYVVVNIVIERTVNALFPGMTQRVVAKCAVMNGLADPLLFLPTFYIFKETIHRANMPDLSTVRPARCSSVHVPATRHPNPDPNRNLSYQVSGALAKYRQNCLVDIRNSWMVWIPGHIVTYGMMPPAFRLPWMSCLSFGYVGLLSVTRGTMEAPPTQVGLTRRLSNAVCEEPRGPRGLTQRARTFVKRDTEQMTG